MTLTRSSWDQFVERFKRDPEQARQLEEAKQAVRDGRIVVEVVPVPEQDR